jgi:dipeptide/tripeptide permease
MRQPMDWIVKLTLAHKQASQTRNNNLVIDPMEIFPDKKCRMRMLAMQPLLATRVLFWTKGEQMRNMGAQNELDRKHPLLQG